MDDNPLAKIARNEKPNTWTTSKTLVRKLNIDITGERTYSTIKYDLKKIKKNKKKRIFYADQTNFDRCGDKFF